MSVKRDPRATLILIAKIEASSSRKVADLAYNAATTSDYLLMAQIANGALDRIGSAILDLDPTIYDAAEGP